MEKLRFSFQPQASADMNQDIIIFLSLLLMLFCGLYQAILPSEAMKGYGNRLSKMHTRIMGIVVTALAVLLLVVWGKGQ
jgi:small neutral amino acid transporter SnatA (MarC family)